MTLRRWNRRTKRWGSKKKGSKGSARKQLL